MVVGLVVQSVTAGKNLVVLGNDFTRCVKEEYFFFGKKMTFDQQNKSKLCDLLLCC